MWTPTSRSSISDTRLPRFPVRYILTRLSRYARETWTIIPNKCNATESSLNASLIIVINRNHNNNINNNNNYYNNKSSVYIVMSFKHGHLSARGILAFERNVKSFAIFQSFFFFISFPTSYRSCLSGNIIWLQTFTSNNDTIGKVKLCGTY